MDPVKSLAVKGEQAWKSPRACGIHHDQKPRKSRGVKKKLIEMTGQAIPPELLLPRRL